VAKDVPLSELDLAGKDVPAGERALLQA